MAEIKHLVATTALTYTTIGRLKGCSAWHVSRLVRGLRRAAATSTEHPTVATEQSTEPSREVTP